MIGKLLRGFTIFCVGTIVTQFILLGYFLARGSLSGDTPAKIVGLLNGIDISGNRLQMILRQSEDREQPDFDEILAARKLEGYDIDLRLRSQRALENELATMLAELRDDRDRLDGRLVAFKSELEQIREGVQQEGLKDVGRTLAALDAEQAKEQLLIMYDEKRIDDVVTIVQAMPSDKRKDILAEFVSPQEMETLAEILRLISDGQPTTGLIDEANSPR